MSSFVNSGYFSLVGYVDSPAEMDRLIDEGHARAILSIPPGFERDLSLRQPVTVQVIIDGDNANTASTVMGYARTLLGEYSSLADAVADVGSRLPARRFPCRLSASSRASGTTRSCAAPCSWCRD